MFVVDKFKNYKRDFVPNQKKHTRNGFGFYKYVNLILHMFSLFKGNGNISAHIREKIFISKSLHMQICKDNKCDIRQIQFNILLTKVKSGGSNSVFIILYLTFH